MEDANDEVVDVVDVDAVVDVVDVVDVVESRVRGDDDDGSDFPIVYESVDDDVAAVDVVEDWMSHLLQLRSVRKSVWVSSSSFSLSSHHHQRQRLHPPPPLPPPSHPRPT